MLSCGRLVLRPGANFFLLMLLDERVFYEELDVADDESDGGEGLRGDFSDPITILQSPTPLSMNSIPSLQTW